MPEIKLSDVEWYPVMLFVPDDPELRDLDNPLVELTDMEIARCAAAEAEFRRCQDLLYLRRYGQEEVDRQRARLRDGKNWRPSDRLETW